MQIAKWNEQTQTPHDIRDRYSVKAGNGVPYSDMASLERLGYHEYIPVALAEGEGLDNPTYALDGGVIRQGGAIIGAVEMQARAEAEASEQATQAQMERHNQVLALTDAYGGMITALGYSLLSLGHKIPCESAEVMADLIQRSLEGLLTPAQEKAKGDVADIYIILKGAGVTDNDIAAVWSITKERI